MPMKFRAHDTFFIRKGWLSKGLRCVFNKPDVFIAHDENPMDVLGLGANMVKALRYWLQAVGLTKELPKGRRIQQFTRLGKIIYQHDTYIEELGTLCLLQYCLASQEDEATAWYFFFNEFSMSEFSREDFVSALQKYIKMRDNETDYAIRSLNDDFQCIINTYLPRYKSNPTNKRYPKHYTSAAWRGCAPEISGSGRQCSCPSENGGNVYANRRKNCCFSRQNIRCGSR